MMGYINAEAPLNDLAVKLTIGHLWGDVTEDFLGLLLSIGGEEPCLVVQIMTFLCHCIVDCRHLLFW